MCRNSSRLGLQEDGNVDGVLVVLARGFNFRITKEYAPSQLSDADFPTFKNWTQNIIAVLCIKYNYGSVYKEKVLADIKDKNKKKQKFYQKIRIRTTD